MAKDRDGTEIQTGDVVLVPCKVLSIGDPDNLIDLQLETVQGSRKNGEGKHVLGLASRQVFKQQETE